MTRFLYSYIVRGEGFLDGLAGWHYCLLRASHEIHVQSQARGVHARTTGVPADRQGGGSASRMRVSIDCRSPQASPLGEFLEFAAVRWPTATTSKGREHVRVCGRCECRGGRHLLSRMLAVQQHRGPDDEGCDWIESRSGDVVGLGSRRLSILDLSAAGHMPMWNADRSIGLAYNGEVYNHQELRRELEKEGRTFRTRTDTEVVLALYERDGVEGFRRLRGMFACPAAVGRPDAPARPGPRPVRHQAAVLLPPGRTFACASELKAAPRAPRSGPDDRSRIGQSIPDVPVDPRAPHPAEARPQAPSRPLRRGEGGADGADGDTGTRPFRRSGRRTAFRRRSCGGETRRRPRNGGAGAAHQRPPGRRASSAPGLDSTSIVACIPREERERLRTYTITFPRSVRRGEVGFDDPDVARRTAAALGTRHQEIVVEPRVADLLERLVWHMDDPVADPAIVMDYLVCREAAKSSTVLLSGVGGDEIFGGYRKYCALPGPALPAGSRG